jgi:hypothetical protein
MTEDPPYRETPVPDQVKLARFRDDADEAVAKLAIEPALRGAWDEAREVLRSLSRHHQHIAEATDLDLAQDPGSRPLALWEASAAGIGLANALVDLADLGYHPQIVPTYRAVHEILGELDGEHRPGRRARRPRWPVEHAGSAGESERWGLNARRRVFGQRYSGLAAANRTR